MAKAKVKKAIIKKITLKSESGKKSDHQPSSVILPTASSTSAFSYYAENVKERNLAARAFIQATSSTSSSKKRTR